MILVIGAIVVGLVAAAAPIWPHSRGWSWWPALILLLVAAVVAGLLVIERIEAADGYQGKAFGKATGISFSTVGKGSIPSGS